MLGSSVCSVGREMRIGCPIGTVWLAALGVQVYKINAG